MPTGCREWWTSDGYRNRHKGNLTRSTIARCPRRITIAGLVQSRRRRTSERGRETEGGPVGRTRGSFPAVCDQQLTLFHGNRRVSTRASECVEPANSSGMESCRRPRALVSVPRARVLDYATLSGSRTDPRTCPLTTKFTVAASDPSV